jgi:hypothetical protein
MNTIISHIFFNDPSPSCVKIFLIKLLACLTLLKFFVSLSFSWLKNALKDGEDSTHDDENHKHNNAKDSYLHPSILADPFLCPINDSVTVGNRIFNLLGRSGSIFKLVISESREKSGTFSDPLARALHFSCYSDIILFNFADILCVSKDS